MIRRQVEELRLRYELEPSLKDVYAEGPADVSLLSWFFRSVGLSGICVYEIQTVHIDADTIPHGLENNNRSRLILLSEKLCGGTHAAISCMACVIDQDVNVVMLGEERRCCVMYTDFACIESYFFDEEQIDRMFNLLFRRPLAVEDFACLVESVRSMFMIRAVFKLKRISRTISPARRSLNFETNSWLLDVRDLLRRSTSRCDVEELIEAIDSLKIACDRDPRYFVQGHDLVSLVVELARSRGAPRELCNDTVVHRGMISQVNLAKLKTFALFENLEKWARLTSSHRS